jgi:hypothetical protein
MKNSRVRQLAGPVAIDAALRAGEDVRLLLVQEDARHEDLGEVIFTTPCAVI